MTTSTSSRALRNRLVTPVVVLLVLGLQPAPAAAAAPGAAPPASGVLSGIGTAVTTTRLQPPAAASLAAPVPGAGAAQPACDASKLPPSRTVTVPPKQSTRLEFDGAQVIVGPGATTAGTEIVASVVCEPGLAQLDQGMTNVTAGPRRGYRLLPHQTFGTDVTVTLPYDPALVPLGLTELDVYTYFYDEESTTWRALERVSIDSVAHTVTSLTDHFTDFVNATLTVPDHPEALSYNPTSIKDIKAADPAAAINVIVAPKATNRGDAALSYPIEVPPAGPA